MKDEEARPLLEETKEENDDDVNADAIIVAEQKNLPESTDDVSMHDSARTEKSELTYKSLPDSVLITVTTILHVSILVLAILIPDIETVFELVGSFGCINIAYVFPAIGYLLALKKFGTE